jgi:hypothetical protein
MRTSVERLIDGVVQTLTDAVLPDLATPFARGQLYAAVDVLKNLRDRVEPRADLANAESDSAIAALERSAAALTSHPALAARIAESIRSAPAGPPGERVAALRAALVDALTAIAGLPESDAEARPARAPIAEHLGAQSMRDVAVLKPSMLSEISRG